MKMKEFKAEAGMSTEIKGVWYKFYAGVTIEVEDGDNTHEVKEKAWNTVIGEIEKQFEDVVAHSK